jgi:hypothetical protein
VEEQATTQERFYDGAERRLLFTMPVIAALASLALGFAYGWRVGLGAALGCAVAYANFYWLRRIVSGLADRATQQGQPSGTGIVFKFFIRYALLGVAAYAIFTVSLVSLYGFLGGLFLPVAAILVEAGYEAYAALRGGN